MCRQTSYPVNKNEEIILTWRLALSIENKKKLRVLCLVLFILYSISIVYFLIFSDMFGQLTPAFVHLPLFFRNTKV